MKGKSAKTEMKGKGAAASGGGRKVSMKSKATVADKGKLGSGAVFFVKDSGKGRLDEVGFGVSGEVKPWAFQSSGRSHGNDRGQVPPPLPVPIASFTI